MTDIYYQIFDDGSLSWFVEVFPFEGGVEYYDPYESLPDAVEMVRQWASSYQKKVPEK